MSVRFSLPIARPPLLQGPVGSCLVLLVLLGLALGPFRPAWGQVDTTDAAPPDSVRPTPPDSVRASQQPLRPFPFASALYGRPKTDSLPGRLPHVSVVGILAEQPSSFLYDLGATGWPHGWSYRGLAPHRTHLWIDGLSLNDPLTARPRFELLPPSFLTPPRTGVDPGGGAVGVHTSWRDYGPERPLTELRYRTGNKGLHAVEVGHSQKRRLDLFDRPGVLHLTFGYGGRKADGVYDGSALRRERRVWGRLRYQTNDWTVELTDRASRFRIGAHGGVRPPSEAPFRAIYALPLAATSVLNPNGQRRLIRNDLTARVRAPLLPTGIPPTQLAASWTSHTFDARTGGVASDTTWSTRLNGGQARLRQSLTVGRHDLTVNARGAVWSVAESNVPQLTGSRGEVHFLLRDELHVGRTNFVLDVGAHRTPDQWFPSATVQAQHPLGPIEFSASVAATGQRGSWIEDDGFASLVRPLSVEQSGLTDRVLKGTVEARASLGTVDVQLRGFAHQIRNAVDLYAVTPSGPDTPMTADTVTARRTPTPVRRAGATLSLGWRRDARRGLYATGHATVLQTLNSKASPLHARLARTLPRAYGRARIGARFVLFTDLNTDLYVQARGWSDMNSRWFHPSTGRLVVPPRQNPIPPVPGRTVGPSGTIDVHAETRLRDATLFFTFENVQARTQLQPGTFVVPVYPLPAQQFRFGVFWPIFD